MKVGNETKYTFGFAESWVHTDGCEPSAALVQASRVSSGAHTKFTTEQWEHLAFLVEKNASVDTIR